MSAGARRAGLQRTSARRPHAKGVDPRRLLQVSVPVEAGIWSRQPCTVVREGFGLPDADAMMRDCPLIVSTSPCLPEVCGDAASYADLDALEQWVAAIARMQQADTLRTDLIARGRWHTQQFSRRRIAGTYPKLMVEIEGVATGPQEPVIAASV